MASDVAIGMQLRLPRRKASRPAYHLLNDPVALLIGPAIGILIHMVRKFADPRHHLFSVSINAVVVIGRIAIYLEQLRAVPINQRHQRLHLVHADAAWKLDLRPEIRHRLIYSQEVFQHPVVQLLHQIPAVIARNDFSACSRMALSSPAGFSSLPGSGVSTGVGFVSGNGADVPPSTPLSSSITTAATHRTGTAIQAAPTLRLFSAQSLPGIHSRHPAARFRRIPVGFQCHCADSAGQTAAARLSDL